MGGKFVISLDFEKYWGVRDHKDIKDYQENLENVDKVVKVLLEKFNLNGIHATWAVVGLLFYRNKEDLMKNIVLNKTLYTNKSLNPYIYIEKNDLNPKYHFSPTVIKRIVETPFQEIASHTFSHFYCLEEGQSYYDFEQDIKYYNKISKLQKVNITTIILPRNQINKDYISMLKKHGFNAFRGNENHYVYKASANNENTKFKKIIRFIDRYINITGHHTYKLNTEFEILNVNSSRFLAPYNNYLKIFEPIRLNRIRNSMTYAAKNDEIFHLWWHPHNFGKNMKNNMEFLDKIIDHFQFLKAKYGFETKNISEIVMGNNV